MSNNFIVQSNKPQKRNIIPVRPVNNNQQPNVNHIKEQRNLNAKHNIILSKDSFISSTPSVKQQQIQPVKHQEIQQQIQPVKHQEVKQQIQPVKHQKVQQSTNKFKPEYKEMKVNLQPQQLKAKPTCNACAQKRLNVKK